MNEPLDTATLTQLTTEVVTSYLSNHKVATGDVARLITAVGQELGAVGRTPEAPSKPEPFVSVGRSVRPDHLVCLVCGKKLKTLRRHLATAHDLTPAAYREMFALKGDYPLVAPAYASERAEIAKRTGLGRRAEPEAESAPAPKRGRAAKAADPATESAPPKPRGRKRATT